MRNAYIFKLAVGSAVAMLLGGCLAYGATPEEIQRAIEAAKAELTPPIQAGTAPASPPPAPASVTSEGHPADRLVAGPARGGFLYADDLPACQQPTPMEGVGELLTALAPQPDETLVDFGCGFDARILIVAVRDYGVRKAIGVEIDPEVAESARLYVEHAGLSDRIEIITGDATKVNVKADVGTGYLFPDVLAKLAPKIRQLKRFASFAHEVPGLSMQQTGDVFVYTKPKPTTQAVAQVMQAFRQPSAIWNGKEYTHRQCSNPRCAMCRAIENQLRQQAARPVVQSSGGHWEMQCKFDSRGRKIGCSPVWVSN